MVVGARSRVAVWSRDRWDQRMAAIPEGPDAALRQAARDLKL
jgi:DNA-binding transcriptional regulator/RsmH inhibitor MraZ